MPPTPTAPPDMNCVAGTITSNTITLPPQAELSIRERFLNTTCVRAYRSLHSTSVLEKPCYQLANREGNFGSVLAPCF